MTNARMTDPTTIPGRKLPPDVEFSSRIKSGARRPSHARFPRVAEALAALARAIQ